MTEIDREAGGRWPVRGAGAVCGLATALLSVFVVPAGLSLSVTLAAMAAVGVGTTVVASRQRTPNGAGAVGAGVAAVLLALAGVSTGLQALLAEPTSGPADGLLRRGSLLLAVLGLVAALGAAAMSAFFRRRG